MTYQTIAILHRYRNVTPHSFVIKRFKERHHDEHLFTDNTYGHWRWILLHKLSVHSKLLTIFRSIAQPLSCYKTVVYVFFVKYKLVIDLDKRHQPYLDIVKTNQCLDSFFQIGNRICIKIIFAKKDLFNELQ